MPTSDQRVFALASWAARMTLWMGSVRPKRPMLISAIMTGTPTSRMQQR
jgi:hypothetical protein